MKKALFLLTAMIIYCTTLTAQTTITTAAAGNIGYDGADYVGPDACVTFVVENTNSHDIILNGLEDFKSGTTPFFPVSPGSFYLWYSATSLSGAATIATPVWTKVSETPTVVSLVPGYNTIFSNLGFVIPANTTYRFALQSLTGIAFSGGLTAGYASPSIMSADSVNLILGDASVGGQIVGWAGSFPSPSYNLSWFTGSITFVSAVACTTPPNAGATISTVSDICSGLPFQLNLTGYSNGFGQTYQWESSLNGTTNWTPIIGATKSAATTTQAVSTYYRCAVTCSGNTAYSTPLQITSPITVSGNYTINSGFPTGGTNFQNFADALSYIGCGINGPVVFNVVTGSGPYNEQVRIPFIGGTSGINTITFKGNGETLSYNITTPNSKAILSLDSVSHIIIDSLNIDASIGTYGWGILITNNADSNIIRKCTITNNTTSSFNVSYNGIVINGSAGTLSTSSTNAWGNNGSYNLIENNTIIGGTYGVYAWGAGSASKNSGNKIINNTFKDFYIYAVSVNWEPTGTIISNNDISRPTRSNSNNAGGIELGLSCSGSLVEKNRIHNMFDALPGNASTCYGINVSGKALAGQPNKIINNLIYNMNGDGTVFGIYNSSANNMQAYHNTIVLDDANAATGISYGLYQNGTASGIIFKNNVVAITRAGTGIQACINYSTNSSVINSNHNALYINCPASTNASIAKFGGTVFTTLANWQAFNSGAYDQQSVSTDPLFLNTLSGDYTPSAPLINDIGENLGVTNDINGYSRTASPDPGAYEFTIPACTNVPIAGTASASVSNTCANTIFGLQLTGNSTGAGQTYQWQSSPNNSSWTNIGTASTNPLFATSQINSSYYRCAVQCSGGTIVYSNSIQVTNPLLLTGIYTINSAVITGGTNFQNFNDAINAIQCGIGGPVVFNVVAGSGPYNEHFTISSIIGSSATNTLTINGNGATLLYSSADANNRTGVILNGAKHVVIDSLTVDVSGGNYSWGMVLTNQADSNIIRKCTIISSTTSNNQNSIGIFLNGSSVSLTTSGNNGSYNTITDNTIIGGYYGIYLYGNSSSSTQNINNIVKRNVLKDMYSYGIYTVYQSTGLVVSENEISRPTRANSTSAGGVYIYSGCNGVLVEKNKVHNLFDAMSTSTQVSYGVFIGATPPVGQESMVINNLVYNMNGNGAVYGILCTFGNNCKMYHNTIVLDDQTATTGTTYGFHQPPVATGIDFRNNLIYISRSGTGSKTCISIGASFSSFLSNNNVLFLAPGTTGNIAVMQSVNYATLADWQAASTNLYDQYSVSANPAFTNIATANFKPTAVAVDNVGTPLDVLTDIMGTNRSIIKPDAGAYEFGVILPVNYVNFKGQRNGSINKLEWVTSTEINNLGFELLRSNSTKNSEFSKIGFIPSKGLNGNSNALLTYSFDDANAAGGITYYKLKQSDKDGRISFSNIVAIKAGKPATIEIASIYPNPVADNLNVSVSSPVYNKATIIIADIYGKTVAKQNISLGVGDNLTSINLHQLAAGSYTIKLSCENGCETGIRKFIKQ